MRASWVAGIGLVAIIMIGTAVWFGQRKENNGRLVEASYFGEKVAKFCLNDRCLEEREGGWWLLADGEQPADEEVVADFAKKIGQVALGEVVSENRQKFTEMGIEAEKQVVLEANGKKLTLGNICDDYSGTYVESNGFVYRINQVLGGKEGLAVDFWRKKWVVNLSPYQISEEKYKDVSYIKALNYLGNKQPGPTRKNMTIKTEEESIDLTIGQVEKSKRYWATTDGKEYFEIEGQDFRRLTAKK